MFKSHGFKAFLIAAAVAASPLAAFADRNDRGYDRGGRYRRDDRRDRDRHDGGGHLDISLGGGTYDRGPRPVYTQQVWVTPIYRTVTEQVWVPAAYRTVIDRVWIEPVTRTEYDREWVPDRFELRDVIRYDEHGRRIVCRENVLVSPGHFEDRPRQVVVTPGCFRDVPRQELVGDGHYEMVNRQELVSPGHWESRSVFAAAPVRDESLARIDLRIPIGR